ncbi:MAG TPA: hypothetical protein VK972_03420, partial [Wenzhouxiangella sp.]|nr:hypothetical protein [Wenzhouxiangella sp.]
LARGELDSARIRVTVNETYSADWHVEGRGWQTVDLPARFADEGRLVFGFEFPDAGSPIDYGHSLDRRLLGMALYRAQIVAGSKGRQ